MVIFAKLHRQFRVIDLDKCLKFQAHYIHKTPIVEVAMTDITYTLAFLGGVMSFLSPCVLPLVPVYVSVISGLSIDELAKGRFSPKALINTLAFVAGFSTIFISLGASSSMIGSLLLDYQSALRVVGGLCIVVFGLFLTGIIKPTLLMKEKRLSFDGFSTGLVGAFFIGIVFAAGWTPCIGPILGSILIYTASEGSVGFGFKLLAVYSLGMAIPFVISALLINLFFTYTRRLSSLFRVLTVLMGIVMIIFGVMLIFDKVSYLSRLFPDFGVRF